MKISKLFLFFVVDLLVILILGFMWFQIGNAFTKHRELSREMLVQEASSNFENMVVMRSWNAQHGGVYALAKKGELPNPYLKDNHLFTSDGKMLIKINPAWMTRQISELSNQYSSYFYKITSLKPLNPHNKADQFETEALQYFEVHPTQKYYYRMSDDFSKFDFMGALKVEPSCMACHAEQGYRVGDIRGGIRVSIPTAGYQETLKDISGHTQFLKLIVVIMGMVTIMLFNWGISRIYRHQHDIEALNASLEGKVSDRTRKLKDLYQHEKYLKEILKTVADVNELLLNSFSVQTVIRNSTDRLSEHMHYKCIWIGMVNNELLEVAYASRLTPPIIDQNLYSLVEKRANPMLESAVNAIRLNQTIIEKVDGAHHEVFRRRKEDLPITYTVSIPLRSSEEQEALGVINVYTDRDAGFEPDEIKMLENLATDIGLTLHTIRQRTILQEMEMEKIENFEETILAFVNIIEQRDSYTAGHTLRVARYCRMIAENMEIVEHDIARLEKAAILHDIGKVATPDAILLKPGRLDVLEYELIKQHAEAGYNMLSRIEMYKDLSEIIRYHHVRYDGKGYPKIDDPDTVPFLSHIMVLADAFDAMTSNRIYKARKNVDEALEEIARSSGTQFHPKVAEAALVCLKEVELEETYQLPANDLEKKRFSYFFEDALTELYNENYLRVVLSDEDRAKNMMHLITLRNFSSFNKTYGWHEGDRFLQSFARKLQMLYPTAMIFRFHGDDFVLLAPDNASLELDVLNEFEFIKSSEVTVQSHRMQLDRKVYSFDEIKLLMSR